MSALQPRRRGLLKPRVLSVVSVMAIVSEEDDLGVVGPQRTGDEAQVVVLQLGAI
jgi:hypothetical protein